MKRFIVVLLSLLMILSLLCCKEEQKTKSEVTPYKKLSFAEVGIPEVEDLDEDLNYKDADLDEKKAFALDAVNNMVYVAEKYTAKALEEFLEENGVVQKTIKDKTERFVRNEEFETESGATVTIGYYDLVSNGDVKSFFGSLKTFKDDITKLDFTSNIEFSSLIWTSADIAAEDGGVGPLDLSSSFYFKFDSLEPIEIENNAQDSPKVHANGILDIKASFTSTKVIKTESKEINPITGEETITYEVYNNPIIVNFDFGSVAIDDISATCIYKLLTGINKLSVNNIATALGHAATDIVATVTWLERDGESITENSCQLSIKDFVEKYLN